jgi:hypothetical protein
MITELIYEYIKNHIRVPMSTFVINNNISVQTNGKMLQKDLRNFLEPYFSVENVSQTCNIEVKLNVYTFDELQMINLLANINNGIETFQSVGSDNRVLNWFTHYENEYTVSYNKKFRTIVLQNNKNPNYLIIVSSDSFVFRITRKIIREEIIYKLNQRKKMIPLDALVLENKRSEGLAIFFGNKGFHSSLIEFIKKRELSCVSMRRAFFSSAENNFIVNGTPEPIKLDRSIIERRIEFKHLLTKRNKLTRRQYNIQDKTFFISPIHFSDYISTSITPHTKLRKIIFLMESDDINTTIRLHSNEVKQKLLSNYKFDYNDKSTPWKPIEKLESSVKIKKVIDEISSEIPCYASTVDELVNIRF